LKDQSHRRSAIFSAAWIAGTAAILVAVAARKLGDFDLPWHLAFGRVVATTGSVPATDDLAHTHPPIEYAEFVADVFLYAVMEIGGPAGLQVLRGLLAAALLTVLAYGFRRDPAARLVAALAVATAGAWILARPATFSFVMLALVIAAIEAHRRNPGAKQTKVGLGLLVPMFALWANLHGFVVIGLALVVGYALYRAACAVARARVRGFLPERDGSEWRAVAVAAAASIVAAMLNVAGPKLLAAPLRVRPDVGRVTEWTPTSMRFVVFEEPTTLLFVVVVIAAVVLGKDPVRRERLPSAWDAGLVVLALVLAANATRLVAVGVVLATPVAIRRLHLLVRPTTLTSAAAAASPWLVAAWLLLRGGASVGIGFEPYHFPEPAVRYIESHGLEGRMWNSFVYGGYLAWRLHPDHRVLVDGRTSWVHRPRMVSLSHRSERDPAAFHRLVTELNLEWAVCRAVAGEAFGLPLASDPQWRMVFWDDVSAVYVRADGVNADLASEGYRVLNHRTRPEMVLDAAVKRRGLAAIAHDAALADTQDPDSPRGAFLQACAAIARRDGAATATWIERVYRRSARPEPALALEAAWDAVRRQ